MRSGYSLGVALAFFLSASELPAQPSNAADEFFEKEVRPLLVEKCARCHGDVRPKGGLKLTSRAELLRGGDRGSAVVPGKPDESLLLKAVRYHEEPRMPPQGKLADRQIEILDRWVKQGAPWPGSKDPKAPRDGPFTVTEEHRRFWSFQPIKAGPPPFVRDSAWPRSVADRYVLAKLEASGLAPAAPSDKRTLLRRATFDLIGLPPTPAEIEAFLSDDSPQAFARVVDRLLASPRYGERWGRHWLDVVRYADARDLIQLPPESDFREAWRYRDWVVESFNRDLPYTDFIRYQVAGDLLPPPRPGALNKDALTATGFLAIADFVPGDVDKNQMIADYVNDQVDVVGRAFLGLSVACARCHDHKFDPISTDDYYALAGIFFSTRIIPGPVAGNTPLVRVPLLSPTELAQIQSQATDDARCRAELERLLPNAVDREYRAHLTRMLTDQTARYVVAACEYRKQLASGEKSSASAVAKQHGLHEGLLTEWVAFLNRIEKQPRPDCPTTLRDVATGKLSGPGLQKAADALQESFAARAKREDSDSTRAPILHFRADDPRLVSDKEDRITLWPNRSGFSEDAVPPTPRDGPIKTTTLIGGHSKSVLRFDGQALLTAPGSVPPVGSLFIVFQTATTARPGGRLLGWEDSDSGKHGLGLMTDPAGSLHAILRQSGKYADIVDTSKPKGFDTVSLTWGPGGATMHRSGVAVALRKEIDGLTSDPAITALKIGGPGSGSAPRFHGDVAEIRVFNRQLDEAERKQVETELHDTWFQPDDPKKPTRDPLAELYDDLRSTRGPFWSTPEERAKRLPAAVRTLLEEMKGELETLRSKRPVEIPKVVVAQDGGPKGSRHEGFKDAQVFIRGDPKRLGKTVPRGFPKVLTGNHEERITEGSGRLQLADWLTRPENPLTARVMVNRIWQHHFGEGLVRTPNDFGERGERPTHPELLDYLAARFVESGWSVKAMHRLIMLSSVYQQSSHASAASLARDPDNRQLGRMNRQRLDAEAIRDSLLTVSGRLNTATGGAPFTDLAIPRRTLYLMSARTGANTSDFGRLFDRADPSLIVAQRGQSVVAPQALFFLNDPFVSGAAKALAVRVMRESPANPEARIRHLYALALGRPPTKAEIDLGTQLVAKSDGPDPWERYCRLILSSNEFLFVD